MTLPPSVRLFPGALAANVGFHIRVVVVDVDLQMGFFKKFGQGPDAGGLPGVDQNQALDPGKVDFFDIDHVKQIDH